MIEGKIYECKNCGCELYDDEMRNNECPKCYVKNRYEQVGIYLKEGSE